MKLKTTNPHTSSRGGVKISNDRRRFLTCGEDKVVNGVFIQDINGKLWTSDEWDNSVTPNGIAVITDKCSFVIALSEKVNIPIDSSVYSSSMNLATYSSSSLAITDFSGPSNTMEMIKAYGKSMDEATGYCAIFTYPNGKKGYLGSAGEWQTAFNNKSAINICMEKVGGEAFDSNYNYYWSSTRADDTATHNCFWAFGMSNGRVYSNSTNSNGGYYDLCARPFSEL